MRIFRRLYRRTQIRYRIEYCIGVFGIYFIRALSPDFAWGAARSLARFAFRIGVRQRAALDNLAQAFPEMSVRERSDIARAAFEHFASMVVDVLFQRRMVSRRTIHQQFRIHGWAAEFMRQHGEEGIRQRAKRILFLTAHIGNWELASGYFGLLGVPIAPVYRSTANPFFNRLLLRLRLEQQYAFIERRGAVNEMLARFEKGENIGFLFDQEAVYGVYVPFFGLPSCTHKTPAVLMRDHGVKIFFGVMVRRGDRYDYEGYGELLEAPAPTADREADIARITAGLMARLEAEVRAHPRQFLWANRRWKRKERA